jgi:crossover junction endodeoxyribonuclease RusA
MARSWKLVYEKRPWSINQERNWHYHKRAKLVDEWRKEFKQLSILAGIPPLTAIQVIATPYLRRPVQDIGNCYPAAKAAIDGIVDADVIPDDTPEYLTLLGFRQPIIVKSPDANALELLVIEVAG